MQTNSGCNNNHVGSLGGEAELIISAAEICVVEKGNNRLIDY